MASFDVAGALHAQRHGITGQDPIAPEGIGAEPTIPDTGWRRILSWTNGVQNTTGQIGTINTAEYVLLGSGHIDLRRKGEWVYLRTHIGAGNTFATLSGGAGRDMTGVFPSGFGIQDGSAGRVAPINHDGLEYVEARKNGGGGLGFPTRQGPLTLVRMSGAWWTFEPFPSEPYPGTPA